MSINFKNEILDFGKNLFINKKYSVIFLCLVLIGSLSMISLGNIQHPKMEIFMFMIVSIIGIFCINFYFTNDSKNELHKIAFILIIIFGLLLIFTMPILEPSDGPEHFTRAEITSRGILFPEYTGVSFSNYYYENGSYVWNGEGFKTISSVKDLNSERYETVLMSNYADDKINESLVVVDQAFQQTAFLVICLKQLEYL